MPLSPEIKEEIALQVIKTLYNQFKKFPEDIHNNRNAPFHEAFLSAFSDKLSNKISSIPVFISLSSWLHGLNTSLGQSFFENTAYFLCGGGKKEFTTTKKNTLKISEEQKIVIDELVLGLTNKTKEPSLQTENTRIFAAVSEKNLVDSQDFTADVFYENHNEVVCVEIKTVNPNKGVFRTEKEKILRAKAALKNKYPQKNIHYYLAFPFDPLSNEPCGYDKHRFMKSNVGFTQFFDEEEVLLAGEFWDYLSGAKNTMREILDIINRIATPNFESHFEFVNNVANRTNYQNCYSACLKWWHLRKEKQIMDKEKLILKSADKKTHNYFNQSCFSGSGEYNEKRANHLLNLNIDSSLF